MLTQQIRTVHVVTLGCSKNVVDSEVLAGTLAQAGLALSPSAEGADALVINTCGFIEAAKEESVNTILEALELKKAGQVRCVVVAGCLAARYGEELQRELPELDLVVGTEQYSTIARFLSPDPKYTLLGERVLSTPSHYAYVKISEGCDHPCSFCAIPLMRGKHRSRPIEQIEHEVRQLVSRGVREIILIGQDTTYYGYDLYRKRTIADLLHRLLDIEGVEWLRLLYAYPSHFPLEVLDVMRERSNMCRYLDLPLQHCSTDILRSMRRGITRRATEELLDTIRNRVPGIALRTTFIVGYPTESEQHFEELCRFVEQQRFDRMGVFTYSHEEGTYAEILGDLIPPEVKIERQRILMELQRDISLERNTALVGKTLRAVVDEVLPNGEYRCRTEADAPEVDCELYVTATTPLQPGDFIQAQITDAAEYDLFGTAVSPVHYLQPCSD
ncbi:MAG: 30S ribosomal protein S12 methylthiotransferase RimO [Bacteroidota bacterium]|nr:30S ribosomal protein S12 methylthiotransferase RimO [Chlorobiota bacterium]MDW8075701.1 30S ribosomal protein S12 methylthiotransferase RimO [Bacteroidota bacterium]